MSILLGADVLIGALDCNDAHHNQVSKLFRSWRHSQIRTYISIINLTEVLVAPAQDQNKLSTAREAISALQISFHQPHEGIGFEAAGLRGRYPISLPGAYCLATRQVSQFNTCVI